MANQKIINLICKLPPKMKRFLMLKIEGDRAYIHGGKPIGPAISAAIKEYVPEDFQHDNDYIKKLVGDIKRCFVRYGAKPAEYFYFGFEGLSNVNRGGYLTETQEDGELIKKTGFDKYLSDLSDKWHFYELAKPFFRRAVILFNENTSKEEIIEFGLNVRDLFIKPLAGSEGEGAFTVSIIDKQSAEELFNKLVASKAKWMVEERIKQSAEMAAWNASSINTVRLPSFLNKKGFFILAPILRTGRAGSCIDNTSAGGVFALIDSVTGKICSSGHDIYNHIYHEHPDSHVTFKGYQIPRWDELVQTARKVHETFPDHIYIAWDFALTDYGWDLIEGNWGRFRGGQLAGKKGIKKEFLQYMNGGSLK